MIDSARTAMSYVEGYGRADFLADKRTQQATVLNLLVIGELAGKVLSDDAAFASDILRCRGAAWWACAIELRMDILKLTLMWCGKPLSRHCPICSPRSNRLTQ